MTKYRIQKEKKENGKGYDYHLFVNGRFHMTFWSKQSLNKYLELLEEEE